MVPDLRPLRSEFYDQAGRGTVPTSSSSGHRTEAKEVTVLFLAPETALSGTLRNLRRVVARECQVSQEPGPGYLDPPEGSPGFYLEMPKNLAAREALGLWVVAVTAKPWWLTLLQEELGYLAYKAQYQGSWWLCHQALKYQTEWAVLEVLLRRGVSPHELNGNTIPHGVELLKRCLVRWYFPKKPKQLQRGRGYRDHGSRRPRHLWLPSDLGVDGNQEKLDLRSQYKARYQLVNWLWD